MLCQLHHFGRGSPSKGFLSPSKGSVITRHRTFLIKSPTFLSYERTPLSWTSVLPVMLKKLYSLKIMLRENILEELFTNVESMKSIISFFTHHAPIWILLQIPHCCFLRHLGLSFECPWLYCHVYYSQTARCKVFLVFIVTSVTSVLSWV